MFTWHIFLKFKNQNFLFKGKKKSRSISAPRVVDFYVVLMGNLKLITFLDFLMEYIVFSKGKHPTLCIYVIH